MIKTEKILVNITYRNITHFKFLNYDAKVGESILVNINDLSKNSRVMVDVECDECKDIKKLVYHKYLKNIEKYGFYTCKKCSTIKKKITYNNNYGVDNPMKLQEFKDKGKQTKLEKYGDENYNNLQKHIETNLKLYGKEHHLQNKDILEKQKLTNFDKYGFTSASKSLIIKDKIISSMNKTKLSNSKVIYKEKYNINILDKIGDFYKIKCNVCNRIYDIKGNVLQLRLIYKNTLCTHCNPLGINNISNMEKDLLNFIKNNYHSNILINSKKIISPYELDIFLPDLKLAFEFNGLYWHSELYKDKNYHKLKTDLCEEKGIQLIHIYEDDWNYKQDIIKSMILYKLNKINIKIFARKTKIKEITDNKLIKKFLNENHIQGFVGAKIKIGLFYDDELVSLMTFGKLRIMMKLKSSNNDYELIRFCNKLNTNVIGGASKLFKYFIEKYKPNEIISYADRGYSNGNLYKQLGFELIHTTPSNYSYIEDNIKKHRFNYRKSNLYKQGFDKNKTEHEIMLERKIYKIYNSGNLKFLFVVKN